MLYCDVMAEIYKGNQFNIVNYNIVFDSGINGLLSNKCFDVLMILFVQHHQ